MRVFRHFYRVGILLVLIALLWGCPGPEGKSQELYKLAQFEEQQNNLQHAKELYEQILTEYPETSFSTKAKARLKEIH